MGHDPAIWQDARRISTLSGPPAYRQKTTEGHRQYLEAPESGYGNDDRYGGGGELFPPPP